MNPLAGTQLIWRNSAQFKRQWKEVTGRPLKAAETAGRIESYRLVGVLKRELRNGAPGGRAFQPLRIISRKSRNRKPLARLAIAVRYWKARKANGFGFSIGFGGPGQASTSKLWQTIALKQQTGFSVSTEKRHTSGVYGTSLRTYFLNIGKNMSRRSTLRKYFFLRASTNTLVTPPRPIIAPFWSAHQREAETNLVSNFNRKMRGERI